MERLSGTHKRNNHWLARIALLVLAANGLLAIDAKAEWLLNGNRVCEAPSPKYNPAIVPSGADAVVVVWTDDRNYNVETDIYATRILLTGERDPRWPALGVPICTTRGMQFAPRLVSDGSGGAIVLWTDLRDGFWGVFAQRLTVSGSIASGWPVDGVRLCSGVGGIVEAVEDGLGGAIAAWRDEQSNAYDIRAHRVAGTGVAPGWPQDGLILVPGLGRQPVLGGLISNGSGGAIITWYTRIDSIDVYAQGVTGSGTLTPGWPSDGLLVCNAPGGQFNPRAATDGNGGAFVAWSDLRTGDEDIYAGHVLAPGSLDPGWPTNGVNVCAAQNVQQNPRMVPDQAGGFVALWMDFRSGTSYDLYAQRILGTGNPAAGWPPDGESLCMAAGHQFDVAAISDGAGGMISAWQDGRADGGDVYAQRITAAGAIAPWATDGVPISEPNFQGGVVLTTDGQQGAMICWVDERSFQDDVYLQRVSASGAVGPDIPVPPVPERLELLAPWPNPGREAVSLILRLPVASAITVDITDIAGRLVAVIQNGSPLPAGDHTITWDGRDGHGWAIPPGLYLVRASAKGHTISRKIVRL